MRMQFLQPIQNSKRKALAILAAVSFILLALASTFAVAQAPPTISQVTPNAGSTNGGTSVTLNGTGFTAGATVTFGSANATNVVVINDTTITATTPANPPGAINVTVTNTDTQSATVNNGY